MDPVCLWCGELVAKDEQAPHFSNPMHLECGVRSVIGSVGHLSGRCSCFVDDAAAAEHDPPGMTKREAARAASALFHRHGLALVAEAARARIERIKKEGGPEHA